MSNDTALACVAPVRAYSILTAFQRLSLIYYSITEVESVRVSVSRTRLGGGGGGQGMLTVISSVM